MIRCNYGIKIKNAFQRWKALHHSSLILTGSIPVGTFPLRGLPSTRAFYPYTSMPCWLPLSRSLHPLRCRRVILSTGMPISMDCLPRSVKKNGAFRERTRPTCCNAQGSAHGFRSDFSSQRLALSASGRAWALFGQRNHSQKNAQKCGRIA